MHLHPYSFFFFVLEGRATRRRMPVCEWTLTHTTGFFQFLFFFGHEYKELVGCGRGWPSKARLQQPVRRSPNVLDGGVGVRRRSPRNGSSGLAPLVSDGGGGGGKREALLRPPIASWRRPKRASHCLVPPFQQACQVDVSRRTTETYVRTSTELSN